MSWFSMLQDYTLDKVDSNFPVTTGRFCFLTNLTNYLNSFNATLTENELACSISYWGFRFDNPKEMNVCGRNEDLKTLLKTFISTYELDTVTFNIDSKKNNLNFLCKKIIKKHYPILWFDSYYLEYSMYYNKTHNDTIVIVLHADQDLICFFDNGLHKIKTDDFFHILKERNQTLFCYCLQEDVNIHKKKLISQGLIKIAQNFTTDMPFSGFNGMNLFLEAFKQLKNKERIYDTYFQLNRPGGLAVNRQMFSEFLIELKNNYHFTVDYETMKHYESLTKNWRLIANLCFKLSFEYSKNLHDRIIERLLLIFSDEQKGYEEIKKIIEINIKP